MAVDWGSAQGCQVLVAASCRHFEEAAKPIDRAACLSALPEGRCDAVGSAQGLPELCVRPAGAAADGAACAWGFDCESLACRKDGACGTCSARGTADASCQETVDCALSDVCNSGKCQKRLDAGAACVDAMDRRCPLGMSCRDGKCSPSGVENEACSDLLRCNGALGFICVESVCKKIAIAGEGDACGLDVPATCAGGLFCAATNRCVKASTLDETCGDGVGCQLPYFCAAGTCTYDTPNTCP